ncbi:MAG: CoA transferase [Dehalococcoidia bacterium]|nr:CoA transferase [Dehalococcoidia bacterium]
MLSKDKQALAGLRVIDLSQIFAGPYATKLLADIGAEIIRVECAARSGRGGALPSMRPGGAFGASFPDGDTGERSYNRFAYYNEVNRNKHAITLDLTKPLGVEVFKRLVRISDVVVENFTPRVMKNFGLDYPVLRETNPQIIMISLSGYGQDGPYRDCVTYGEGIEAMVGLSQLTAYPDGEPLKPGVAYADATSGLHAAFAILAALRYRRLTGNGQYIDLAMREAVTPILGEAIMDYTMNKRVIKSMGNRHPTMAPHGCYRAQGRGEKGGENEKGGAKGGENQKEGAWIAIAVSSDEEWRAFCRAMGDPPWTRDEKFANRSGRLANREELDRLIGEWTSGYDHIELMNMLQGSGIKAGAVLNIAELAQDPHLNERGFFEELPHPEAGTHRYPGVSWRMSRTPGRLRLPAPCFGEHNRYVFGELLGMPDEEVSLLEDEGVSTSEPLPYLEA